MAFFNKLCLILACLFSPSYFSLYCLGQEHWNAVLYNLYAIVSLRQIPILTGDTAQSNMLLFIRIGLWQQIILVPLFPSFKVMAEFTGPYAEVSDDGLHFLHSKLRQLTCKDKEKAICSKFGITLQLHPHANVARDFTFKSSEIANL